MMEKRPNKPTEKMFCKTSFLAMVILTVVITGLIIDTTRADNDNFYADIIRLDNVATKIHQSYVEDIPSKELIDNAIEGMIKSLDPHTSYFETKQYEELRIHTEGKFGGLGIQISIRDDVLTVMTPIGGTPASRAGIQSGDQIIQIEGESTEGITIDKAVNKLRGEPGSEVTILIRRTGEQKDIEYTITREIVQIKSVPFYGMMDDGIGYIHLQAFSQEAANEVENAIKDLKSQGLKGLVFDLRLNPGGLLPQAIEVTEKFLPSDKLIVSTRGRVRGQNKDFHSSRAEVLPTDMPLVVLVNRASASASEIVAGAIQDWDRGIVLGDTTFGKGSVQSVIPLDKSHHIKLTTALYYTPSGRCIDRPNIARDTADEQSDSEADTNVYRTKNGRIVYGGGGIVPDFVVEPELPSMPVRALFGEDAFFQFANMEYPRLQKRDTEIGAEYTIDKKTIEAFYDFLDSIEFSYKNAAQIQFEEFKKRSGLIADTTKSDSESQSGEPKWSEEHRAQLDETSAKMKQIFKAESQRELEENREEIKRHIRKAILIREYGQDNEIVYRSRLSRDKQLDAAMQILTETERYEALLKAPEQD
ncbi:S41 family peptidase [Chitinispirillales bacterium ANBcel5]|uniref:S41 family peptidase n=1 Tax=Cellulosispirillum alkaliphilum TaxID=3039283 RepID=UPI002A5480A3|nr:S41 family peptidase [Chitinispirillales bacterium ANBcel5]